MSEFKKGERAEKFEFGTITLLLIFNAWDELREAVTYGVEKATLYQLRNCQSFIVTCQNQPNLSKVGKLLCESIFDELERACKSKS